MAPRSFDYQASTVTLRTKAKGLLSRLAHDLELAAERFEGEIDLDGDAWRATLRFPVKSIRVVGVVRAGSVDRAVLSTGDREEIERRLRDDVLTGDAIEVRASGTSRAAADLAVRASRGEQRLRAPLAVEERRDGELVAHGKLALSLRALGIPEVKGPLGAFKVDDEVEVAFWMMLEAPGRG